MGAAPGAGWEVGVPGQALRCGESHRPADAAAPRIGVADQRLGPPTTLFSSASTSPLQGLGPRASLRLLVPWGVQVLELSDPQDGWAPILTLAESLLPPSVGRYSLRCLEGPLWEALPCTGLPSCSPSFPLVPSPESLT